MLSTTAEDTGVHTSWCQKWKQRRSKPSSAALDNDNPLAEDFQSNDTVTAITTTSTSTTTNEKTTDHSQNHLWLLHSSKNRKKKTKIHTHTHTHTKQEMGEGMGKMPHRFQHAFSMPQKKNGRHFLGKEMSGLIVGKETED